MRKKMYYSQAKKLSENFNIKQDAGGIIDIEFIVQYLILLHANHYPNIIEFSDNIRMINSLLKENLISSEIADTLTQIYQKYRDYIHQQALQEQPGISSDKSFSNEQSIIKSYWKKIIEANNSI